MDGMCLNSVLKVHSVTHGRNDPKVWALGLAFGSLIFIT